MLCVYSDIFNFVSIMFFHLFFHLLGLFINPDARAFLSLFIFSFISSIHFIQTRGHFLVHLFFHLLVSFILSTRAGIS